MLFPSSASGTVRRTTRRIRSSSALCGSGTDARYSSTKDITRNVDQDRRVYVRMSAVAQLETELAGLYASPPEPLPFAPSLTSAPSSAARGREPPRLQQRRPPHRRRRSTSSAASGASTSTTGTSRCFASDWLDAPLFVHERDREEVARSTGVSGTFSDRHTLDGDFEVIPDPGHTAGRPPPLGQRRAPLPLHRRHDLPEATESGSRRCSTRATAPPTSRAWSCSATSTSTCSSPGRRPAAAVLRLDQKPTPGAASTRSSSACAAAGRAEWTRSSRSRPDGGRGTTTGGRPGRRRPADPRRGPALGQRLELAAWRFVLVSGEAQEALAGAVFEPENVRGAALVVRDRRGRQGAGLVRRRPLCAEHAARGLERESRRVAQRGRRPRRREHRARYRGGGVDRDRALLRLLPARATRSPAPPSGVRGRSASRSTSSSCAVTTLATDATIDAPVSSRLAGLVRSPWWSLAVAAIGAGVGVWLLAEVADDESLGGLTARP